MIVRMTAIDDDDKSDVDGGDGCNHDVNDDARYRDDVVSVDTRCYAQCAAASNSLRVIFHLQRQPLRIAVN